MKAMWVQLTNIYKNECSNKFLRYNNTQTKTCPFSFHLIILTFLSHARIKKNPTSNSQVIYPFLLTDLPSALFCAKYEGRNSQDTLSMESNSSSNLTLADSYMIDISIARVGPRHYKRQLNFVLPYLQVIILTRIITFWQDLDLRLSTQLGLS